MLNSAWNNESEQKVSTENEIQVVVKLYMHIYSDLFGVFYLMHICNTKSNIFI